MGTKRHLGKLIKIFLVALQILLLSNGLVGYAVDSKKEGSTSDVSDKTGFTVEAIQPETQIKKEFSFFYIRVEPEEPQTLKVKVISKRKEPSKIKIHLNNAVTNIMGQVDYGQENPELDSSMKLPLTYFVKLKEKTITVKNFEEKIVELEVTPPKEKFSGVRLGAISFQSIDKKEDESGVKSNYGYKIGLMASEDQAPYNVGGAINHLKVGAALYNGEKVVAMTLQNPKPVLLENVTVQTKLYKKGSKEVIASNALQGMRLAPNSSFDFLTYLGIEELKPGKYIIESHATDEKKNWDWKKEFEVTDKQANQINEDAAYKITMPKLYKGFGIGLIVLTLGNIGYLVYRKRKTSETKKGGGKDDASEG
ncbi:DUF916 and DUF3324 domain-containing protein [Enterococcus hulanensis]|uniref:DUF916 and DUF3324 domain-containing protein n=1 Tax=Enterococcus hulanensis TaxID=2559929 RepID=UPI0028909C97|nr:DUF916 and DUF3324 domain-containing protein [Enterococcus hulanensis]MDT2661648.1 DUF916 and DUF3324 domain-containing protein [Enterococcus hulanensis]